MEISTVTPKSLRIKGKHVSFIINPQDKLVGYNAVFFLSDASKYKAGFAEDVVVINGAGDYEVAGTKISGMRNGDSTIYSMNVDGIDILFGNASTLDTLQHKVKEHHMLLLNVTDTMNVSFATSLATNVVLFYGEKAAEVVKTFAKDAAQETTKYQTTADKLPAEMETILLQ